MINRNDKLDTLDQKLNEIQKLLWQNKISCDVHLGRNEESPKEEAVVIVEILWGDWKHDHRKCINIMQEHGFDCLRSNVTDEDDGDAYCATHVFSLPKDSYSLREVSCPYNIGFYIVGEKVRQICIDNNWYTHGDVTEYSKMLDYCFATKTSEGSLEDAIYSIAEDIYLHSEMRSETEHSREDYIQNVMYYIATDALRVIIN